MMRIRRILYPTDFSDTARQALMHALFLAEQFEAELHMLHAIILMDSRITSTSPSATWAPSRVSILKTVPVMCASTWVAKLVLRGSVPDREALSHRGPASRNRQAPPCASLPGRMLETLTRGFKNARDHFKGVTSLNGGKRGRGAAARCGCSLLEADVDLDIVRGFLDRVKEPLCGRSGGDARWQEEPPA